MHFAAPIPWWLALLAAAGIVLFAVAVYRRPLLPLSPPRRAILSTLRALSLGLLLALLCRPVLLLPPRNASDLVVPVLIDTSRSMRIADVNGGSRLAGAVAVARDVSQQLSTTATVQLFSFSDAVASFAFETATADGAQTKLQSALDSVRARFRGQRVPGIVVISDGAETEVAAARSAGDAAIPIFAIGVGAADGIPDREVTGITAGDPRLDQAASDLRVTAVTRGFGRNPVTLSVLVDGVVAETRQVTPADDGLPIDELFTVFPDTSHASLYTASIEAAQGEAVLENNRRSLAISPAGRRRRLLMLSGAPGYDHSFLLRALQQDPGLDVDVIVRKGKNDANQDTFMVQAGGNRASLLVTGFPASKEALFGYDAIIVSNMEGEFFSRDQLTQLAAFVGQRGGGLLLMGGRSFERRGLTGTPLEEVLPVALTDRRGGAVGLAAGDEGGTGRETLALTDEGLRHPIMRIGTRADQWKTQWATLPPLTASAPLGGPRPGASVLAVTTGGNGGLVPVVAVQQYGRGRSMVFAGEASWRWRMLVPAADRRYDFFWRQSARWLSNDAPEPISMTLPPAADAGDPLAVPVDVRDAVFEPVTDASVEVRLTLPNGQTQPLSIRPLEGGHSVASGTLAGPGLYRLQADARRNGVTLGSDDRWFAVGDHEREFADVRLNEGTLRRIARDSGGKYVRAVDAASLTDELSRTLPAALVPQQRELWHQPWTFLLVVGLIVTEWSLRRAWGLR